MKRNIALHALLTLDSERDSPLKRNIADPGQWLASIKVKFESTSLPVAGSRAGSTCSMFNESGITREGAMSKRASSSSRVTFVQ